MDGEELLVGIEIADAQERTLAQDGGEPGVRAVKIVHHYD
jgi:hypothetical protein